MSPRPPGMSSGHPLVLGWLSGFSSGAFVRLWIRPRAPCVSCPTISEGCPYTYIGAVFFLVLGWVFRFSGFLFGFFLLGFLVIYRWAIFLGFGVF